MGSNLGLDGFIDLVIVKLSNYLNNEARTELVLVILLKYQGLKAKIIALLW